MKKFRIGISFLLLIIVGIVAGQVLVLFNYILALSLHELAHLFVAVKNGYSLKVIKLDMFGLSVELNEKVDDRDSFKINIAGPIFNLFMCLICMALYWLIPKSFLYLNTFCLANLVLAIFNLLPVYPLDGGKIFSGLIKSDKVYKILDTTIRYLLASLFICAFIISCFNKPNLLMLIMSIFFIISKGKQTPTMTIFKYRQNKHFDKVVILKVDKEETLFNLIKQIKTYHYTIFYVPTLNKYFDEDNVIDLSLKHPLTTQIIDLKPFWELKMKDITKNKEKQQNKQHKKTIVVYRFLNEFFKFFKYRNIFLVSFRV